MIIATSVIRFNTLERSYIIFHYIKSFSQIQYQNPKLFSQIQTKAVFSNSNQNCFLKFNPIMVLQPLLRMILAFMNNKYSWRNLKKSWKKSLFVKEIKKFNQYSWKEITIRLNTLERNHYLWNEFKKLNTLENLYSWNECKKLNTLERNQHFWKSYHNWK